MDRRTSLRFAFRYVVIALTSAIAVQAAVGIINVLIDPFGIYRVVEREGFNAYKPAIYPRVRLYKAYEVTRRIPQALILGTSRTHVALRCSHEAFRLLNATCYNLAFDGATTREMYHYLRHAHMAAAIKHLVLGLDTYHLTSSPSFTRPDFDPLVLYRPDKWRASRFITGDLRLLVNLDTVRASVQTIASQQDSQPDWFAPDGQRLGPVFFRRVNENFLRFGPRAYFDEIDRLEVGSQTEGTAGIVGKRSKAAAASLDLQESSIGYLFRIISFCRAEHIDVRIFITPSHVHQLEIIAATGAESATESGKRELVWFLAEDATQHPGSQPIRLIDFSGYSSVTTEPLPRLGSWDEMHYYWDSSHFKEIVGDYVLDRLFDVRAENRLAPSDFGLPLTSATVDKVFAEQHRRQAVYRQQFAGDVRMLRLLVQVAAQK